MSDFVLPEEIMLCILTSLPVKSLLRFKSVCKSWHVLFGTREFMKMHCEQFSTDPENQNFIIYILSGPDNPSWPVYPRTTDHSNFDQTLSLVSIGSETNKPTNLDVCHCKMQDIRPRYFVGCCNGLICISLSRGFALWNPALRLFKYVFGQRYIRMIKTVGLGHDAEGDDFKIVSIIFSADMIALRAEVYSTKSDSWKTMEVGLQFRTLFQNNNNAIVNGNPYWVVNLGEDYDSCVWGLVRFDASKMVFEMVPVSTIDLGYEKGLHIVDWKGSLAALVSTTDDVYLWTSVDIWVMNEGEMIWTKIHTFGPIIGRHFTVTTRFLQYSKSGKIVEYTSGKLFVIDPKIGFLRSIEVSDVAEPYYFDICGYNEGLAYVEGMLPQLIIPITDENEQHAGGFR